MKKLSYLLLIFLPILFTGCDSDEDTSIDKTAACSRLANALIANDNDIVGAEINHILLTQGPYKGLEESLEKLVEQINACPTLQVTDSCFGCIYTNPPQSEIRITITSNNQTFVRAMNLRHSETGLTFVAIYD